MEYTLFLTFISYFFLETFFFGNTKGHHYAFCNNNLDCYGSATCDLTKQSYAAGKQEYVYVIWFTYVQLFGASGTAGHARERRGEDGERRPS